MHDSHIHLALNPLTDNRYRDLEEFIQAGGKKILTQTTEYTDYNKTIEIVDELNKQFPGVVDLALGIHPTIFQDSLLRNDLEGLDTYKYSQKIINYFEQYFEKYKEKITAIGETGLDYFDMYKHNEFSKEQRESLIEIQKRSFRIQCKTAVKNKLPLSIHAREMQDSNQCVKDVLDILAQEGNGLLTGVFHSYTGSIEMLEDILNMGFYVGFNAIITYPSGEDVRKILEKTPTERILFETDGPFLTVQSERKNKKAPKRYGRPISISEILDKVSEVKGIDRETLEQITDQNYLDLFKS